MYIILIVCATGADDKMATQMYRFTSATLLVLKWKMREAHHEFQVPSFSYVYLDEQR